MASNPYKVANQTWHWCTKHSTYLWMSTNVICPNCDQLVTTTEGSQHVQTAQWSQPANIYNTSAYGPPSTLYEAPILPSNTPVQSPYYSNQTVVASQQQYGYSQAQATSSTSAGPASQTVKQGSGSRWVCDLCPAGQSVFGREPDLARHKLTVHEKDQLLIQGRGFDCPHEGCDRKGRRAFTRHDHMLEHRRGYHKESGLDKRTSRSTKKDG